MATATSPVQDMVQKLTIDMGKDGGYIAVYRDVKAVSKTRDVVGFHFGCNQGFYSESEIARYLQDRNFASVNATTWDPEFFKGVVEGLTSKGYSKCNCYYKRGTWQIIASGKRIQIVR